MCKAVLADSEGESRLARLIARIWTQRLERGSWGWAALVIALAWRRRHDAIELECNEVRSLFEA